MSPVAPYFSPSFTCVVCNRLARLLSRAVPLKVKAALRTRAAATAAAMKHAIQEYPAPPSRTFHAKCLPTLLFRTYLTVSPLRRIRTTETPTSAAPTGTMPTAATAATTPIVAPAGAVKAGEETIGETATAATAENPQVFHQSARTPTAVEARLDNLKTHLLAANWQDYITFVLNYTFWEVEMRVLELEAQPFIDTTPRVQELLGELRRIFDLMAQVSDVRDHINQILELGSRATGLAGTGLNAAEKVDNFQEHVGAVSAIYDHLMKEYPEYCVLIDDAVGSGLALMRQKQRFTFSGLHRYFY